MDGDALDVEFLLAAAGHEIGALRGDRRLAPLPGKRGAALRDHLLDLIGAVEHRMTQAPPATAPHIVRRAFARSLRQSIVMLRGAHAALPWLAGTRTPNVNLGSLYVAEECARILVGTNVDLIVVPDPEFMYSTTSWPFSAVVNTTSGFTPTNTRRPIVLNYPLSDADRLLLHPIFAHELGHASVDQHQLVSTVETELDNDPDFTTALQSKVNDMAASYWPALAPTQISGILRARLRDWIEELLCDHLAIEAVGPSFMWAFVLFVLPLGYAEPGEQHPPNTVRIKLALDHLTRRGWRPHMERVAPGVTSWIDQIAGDAAGALEPPFDFLRDQLTRHATVLQDVATQRSGSGALDAFVSAPQADEAADLLRRLILPVGLTTPLDARAILLGGWQYAFQEHGDKPPGLIAALDDRRLQELVGKAIEMSTVASAWVPSL
ncbi:MAG TPA: hypothetical protein VG165_00665 [Solirubrobacteraceae bacterium]|jgi:hypothetical protein|nr:hypothetical protein [Solirubrobacteraceae bacterium]